MIYRLTLLWQLRSWRTWLLLLLLPALIFTASQFLSPEDISAPVQVGVCLPETGGEEFWQHLSSRFGTVIAFQRCDRETLIQKVSTGQWDCGLLPDPEFQKKIQSLDTKNLITLYISQSSTVYPLVEETVSCAVMELISPIIAREYAQDAGITGPLSGDWTLQESEKVLISLETLSGKPLTLTDLGQTTRNSVLLGCIGLLLLLWTLFSAMDLGQWYDSLPVRRMGMVRSPVLLLLPRAAALLTPALLSALLGLVLLGSSFMAVAAAAVYLLTLGCLSLVLCRWRVLREALPCLMPFIVVLSLIFSPMVFDISHLFPSLAPLCRYLPLSLFLTACGGDWATLGILAAQGAGCLLIFLCIPEKR